MHTAYSLKKSMFSVSISGTPADPDAVFEPEASQRIGVVVTSPLGALGASFLIQLGITAYYDVPNKPRMGNPHYPELYIFHLGGAFGDFSMFDAWPIRKQVFLPNDGAAALASINSHAITHLLLPDEPERTGMHDFVEPNAALDRLRRCFVYDPSGRTRNGEIAIRALDLKVNEDIRAMIRPHEAVASLLADYVPPEDTRESRDNDVWISYAKAHAGDVDQAASLLAERRRDALDDGSGPTEIYREITALQALRRLGRTE